MPAKNLQRYFITNKEEFLPEKTYISKGLDIKKWL